MLQKQLLYQPASSEEALLCTLLGLLRQPAKAYQKPFNRISHRVTTLGLMQTEAVWPPSAMKPVEGQKPMQGEQPPSLKSDRISKAASRCEGSVSRLLLLFLSGFAHHCLQNHAFLAPPSSFMNDSVR